MVWGGCAAVVIRGKVVMEPLIAQASPHKTLPASAHVPLGLPHCLEARQLLCLLHLRVSARTGLHASCIPSIHLLSCCTALVSL